MTLRKCNLRVFTFEKSKNVKSLGLAAVLKDCCRPNRAIFLLYHFCAKSATVLYFLAPQGSPRNLAFMEREAREAREPQALQATQEQREQQEGQEQERQHQEEQQRKRGKSSPSINTASVHYRLGREYDEEQ